MRSKASATATSTRWLRSSTTKVAGGRSLPISPPRTISTTASNPIAGTRTLSLQVVRNTACRRSILPNTSSRLRRSKIQQDTGQEAAGHARKSRAVVSVRVADSPPTEEAAADPPDAPQPQAEPAEPAPARERTPRPVVGGEGAGWEWINWVRTGLRDGSVPVNAVGAWLHNIAGEGYVVSPTCFEAFAAGRELAPATVRNGVGRLGRHRQRASPSGSANVFRAVLADGSRVKGMVFPGELFWDDDPPSRANAELVRKGR